MVERVIAPLARGNREPRYRGTAKNDHWLHHRAGAVLAEQHDEWTESRRYLDLGVLSKSLADHDSPTEQEATPAALTA